MRIPHLQDQPRPDFRLQRPNQGFPGFLLQPPAVERRLVAAVEVLEEPVGRGLVDWCVPESAGSDENNIGVFDAEITETRQRPLGKETLLYTLFRYRAQACHMQHEHHGSPFKDGEQVIH